MNVGCEPETPPPMMNEPIHRCRTSVSIGDISIGINGHSADDILLSSEMAPFQLSLPSCDIEVAVERVPHLQPSHDKKLFDSGALWTVHDCGAEYIFDFTTPVFGAHPYKQLHADRQFRRASLLMSGEYSLVDKLPPLGYPLDELLITHRLACDRGVEFHSCGLVDAERGGFLFLGYSTAGKSTTARLWKSVRDVTVLSDDRIIVRRQGDQTWMYGTPWHGEAQFALPEKAVIQRIFVIEHGPENEITLLSKNRAVAEMFARCFVPFYSSEYLESTLAYLSELADAVPCYRFRFRPEPAAVDMVLSLHE